MVLQYLLGALPAAETERLDELSIADNEFAESLRIAEHELLDAYVQGELSGVDLQRFNSSYLGQAKQRERIAFAQALQEWAHKETARESAGRSRHVGWWSWLFSPPQVALRWAVLAVALILFTAAGLLLFRNLRWRSQLRQEQARREQLQRSQQETQRLVESQRSANANSEPEIARTGQPNTEPSHNGVTPSPGGRVVSFMLAPPMREAAPIRTVPLPSDTGLVKIQLELEADFPVYRVQLLDSVARQTLWRSANLKPRASGPRKVIELSLPPSLLKSATYVLQVSGVSPSGSSEIVGDYSFRVKR